MRQSARDMLSDMSTAVERTRISMVEAISDIIFYLEGNEEHTVGQLPPEGMEILILYSNRRLYKGYYMARKWYIVLGSNIPNRIVNEANIVSWFRRLGE